MSIRPGCTLRPPERPNILGAPDIQPLLQSGPSPPVASPETACPPIALEAVKAVEPAAARPVTSEDFPYFRRKPLARL
jgi:hypothetical protein